MFVLSSSKWNFIQIETHTHTHNSTVCPITHTLRIQSEPRKSYLVVYVTVTRIFHIWKKLDQIRMANFPSYERRKWRNRQPQLRIVEKLNRVASNIPAVFTMIPSASRDTFRTNRDGSFATKRKWDITSDRHRMASCTFQPSLTTTAFVCGWRWVCEKIRLQCHRNFSSKTIEKLN